MQTDYWRFMRHMHTGSPAVCRFAYAPDGAAVAAATTPGTQTARGVIKLAHLQRGSVTVQPGDAIAAGEIVGRVGNSGNSSEPHLHVHAVREDPASPGTETPVPILVDDAFPVRNTILADRR
jgi:hypothetical protein